MNYPNPVPVILPGGREVLGVLTAADRLDIEFPPERIQLRDQIIVDGMPRQVFGMKIQFARPGETHASDSTDASIRIRLSPLE